jgi:hypothetical protein
MEEMIPAMPEIHGRLERIPLELLQGQEGEGDTEYRPPPINDIVNFLESHSPNDLDALRHKYPEAERGKILQIGIIAGSADRHLPARAETAYRGLEGAVRVCEQLIPKIQEKLRRAGKYQFIGQVMSVIGGASIFGTLAGDFPKAATYAGALVTLIGSLMPQIAQYAGRALSPESNLFDIFKELISCRTEANLIRQEIEPWIGNKAEGDDEEYTLLKELITKANSLCSRVTQVEPLI